MKHILRLLIGLMALSATACIHEFPIADHSFDFSGAVVYDQVADEHLLTLTCNKHSGAEQYNIVFHVDGENVITLTDIEGKTYQEWFRDSFAETDSHSYTLSEAPAGNHVVQLTISTDGFCQSMEIPYEVITQKHDIGPTTLKGKESSSGTSSIAL